MIFKGKDKVKVKVLSIDERGKIGLSIKQLTPPPPAPPKPQRPVSQERRAPKWHLLFPLKINYRAF